MTPQQPNTSPSQRGELETVRRFLYDITLDMCRRQPDRVEFLKRPITNEQFAKSASERYLLRAMKFISQTQKDTITRVLERLDKPRVDENSKRWDADPYEGGYRDCYEQVEEELENLSHE